MHRDTVIGIVGVVILVAAMVGVFTYERGQAADVLGDTTASLANLTGPSLSGSTPLGEATTEVVALNQTGIANATFTLRWTPGSGVDTLRLTVAPSAATGLTEGGQAEESDGEITVTVPVGNTGSAGQLGVGDWEITVEFVSASTGLPAEPPVPPPGTTDTEVSWTLDTTLEAYAAQP